MKYGDYYPEEIYQCPPSPNSSTYNTDQREKIQRMNDDFGNESLLVNMDHLATDPEPVEPEPVEPAVINDQAIEDEPDINAVPVIDEALDVAAVPVVPDAPEIATDPADQNEPERANHNRPVPNDVDDAQEPENLAQNAPEPAGNRVRPRTVLGGQTVFEAILEISHINAVSDGLTWYKFTAPKAVKLRSGNQAEFLVGYTDIDAPLCRYQDKQLTRNVAIQVRPKNESVDTQTTPPANPSPASTPPPPLEGSTTDNDHDIDSEVVPDIENEIVNDVQDNIFTHDPLEHPLEPTTTMEQDRSKANFNLKK